MADLSITTGNVAVEDANASCRSVQYGETVTKGVPVYRSTADGKYYQAQNDVDDATAAVRGIVLIEASTDGYGVIVTGGPLDIGATLAVGTAYVLSAAVSKICPAADLATGNRITHLGYGVAADKMDLSIKLHPGVTHP